MATQLLNADAQLSSIQDLMGHSHITTTQRYCRVANLKVQRDYYKAMEVVLQRTQAPEEDEADDRQSPGHAQENRTPRQREHGKGIALSTTRGHGTCTRLRPQKNTLPLFARTSSEDKG